MNMAVSRYSFSSSSVDLFSTSTIRDNDETYEKIENLSDFIIISSGIINTGIRWTQGHVWFDPIIPVLLSFTEIRVLLLFVPKTLDNLTPINEEEFLIIELFNAYRVHIYESLTKASNPSYQSIKYTALEITFSFCKFCCYIQGNKVKTIPCLKCHII